MHALRWTAGFRYYHEGMRFLWLVSQSKDRVREAIMLKKSLHVVDIIINGCSMDFNIQLWVVCYEG